MSGRAVAAATLAAALLLLAAAPPPRAAFPTGRLAVAGVAVAPDQVLDARALPDMAGKPSLMVTLTPGAAQAVAAGAHGADPLPVTLDGTPLGASPAAGLASGVVQLSGDYGDYTATGAIARRISGHDPVPDSEGDE